METLIRELESLRNRPQLTNAEVAGAMMAMTVRFRDVLEERMVGIRSLAAAVAMQPNVDFDKLHDDFRKALVAHFESAQAIPTDLKDIASAIQVAGTERQ